MRGVLLAIYNRGVPRLVWGAQERRQRACRVPVTLIVASGRLRRIGLGVLAFAICLCKPGRAYRSGICTGCG